MSNFFSDLQLDAKFAMRAMASSPGSTLIAVLALTLGIGASTAVFTIADGVLLKELPYEDPDRLVVIVGRAVSAENYQALRDGLGAVEGMALFTIASPEMVGPRGARRGSALPVGPDFLSILGTQPRSGRLFSPEDFEAGSPPTAVLTDSLWRDLLGADPEAIGSTIRLDGVLHTVIGVMPPDWRFMLYPDYDIFVPLHLSAREGAMAIGRLRDGVSFESARAEAEQVGTSFAVEPQGRLQPLYFRSLNESVIGSRGLQLSLLAGAVSLVMLVACANVANLLLARSFGRRSEISVRSALGASRGRLVRQLLTESGLLALLGGTLGVLVAWRSLPMLTALSPGFFRAAAPIGIDLRVLGFAVLASVVTVAVFGLAPALFAGRPDLKSMMSGGDSRSTDSRRGRRVLNGLVVAEIALSLVLLVGTGLLVRTFLDLAVSSPGFNPSGKLLFEVRPTERRYPDGETVTRLYDRVLTELRELPGVEAAAAISAPPLATFGLTWTAAAVAEGADAASPDLPTVFLERVSSNYHDLMEIRIVLGRALADDVRSAIPEIVVSERAASRVWPNEDPLGQRVTLKSFTVDMEFVVVGVGADTRFSGRRTDAAPTVWIRYRDSPDARMTFLMQVGGAPAELAQPVRALVARIDPELPFWTLMTMDEVVYRSVSQARFYMTLMGIFGGIAILLAAIGFYGVMAHAVGRRTHELGIRLTLGASPRALRWMVLRQGATLVAVGVAVGLAGCFAVLRLIESWLYGVSPTDPLTYAVLVAVVIVVGLAASYIPARRATRIDPLEAMQSQ